MSAFDKLNLVWCVFVTDKDGDAYLLASFSSMSKAADFRRKISDRTRAPVWICASRIDDCDGDTFDITNIVEEDHIDA